LLVGNIVLTAALILYAIDFLSVLRRRPTFGLHSLQIAGLLSIAASLWFSWSFIRDNFLLKAVYEESSRSLSPLLKLSASWTGAAGSLLLWLLMMTVALLALRLKSRHSMNHQTSLSCMVMSFFTMAVVGFVLATNPFAELAVSVPNGLGLNPSLQTPLSAIHPPLVFASYTALLVSYSTVLGSRWTQKSELPSYGERILWASWVLLTLAISAGGFWAYRTLGWGGYWAWDPLETSALIPWLFLTALLFSRLMGGSAENDLLAVTLTVSSLFLTVYVARSTAVPSVHAYGNFFGGGAVLLLAGVPIMLSFIATHRNKQPRMNPSSDNLPAALVFWSLMLIASIDALLLLDQYLSAALGIVTNPSEQLYNYASFPALVVFLGAMSVKCLREQSTRRQVILLFGLLLGVGLTLTALNYPLANILVNFGLPFILGTLGTSLYSISRWGFRKHHFHPYSDLKFVAFLGVAVLLLGIFLSSSMQTTATKTVSVGGDFSALDLKIHVVQITTSPSTSQIFLPPYGMVPESIDSSVFYTSSLELSVQEILHLRYYPALDQFSSTPLIHSSISEDIYIVASATGSIRQTTALAFRNRTAVEPTDVQITVTRIPAISFVWVGALTMLIPNLPLALLTTPEHRGFVSMHMNTYHDSDTKSTCQRYLTQ
jgi:cytochrome c biogenesis factor